MAVSRDRHSTDECPNWPIYPTEERSQLAWHPREEMSQLTWILNRENIPTGPNTQQKIFPNWLRHLIEEMSRLTWTPNRRYVSSVSDTQQKKSAHVWQSPRKMHVVSVWHKLPIRKSAILDPPLLRHKGTPLNPVRLAQTPDTKLHELLSNTHTHTYQNKLFETHPTRSHTSSPYFKDYFRLSQSSDPERDQDIQILLFVYRLSISYPSADYVQWFPHLFLFPICHSLLFSHYLSVDASSLLYRSSSFVSDQALTLAYVACLMIRPFFSSLKSLLSKEHHSTFVTAPHHSDLRFCPLFL